MTGARASTPGDRALQPLRPSSQRAPARRAWRARYLAAAPPLLARIATLVGLVCLVDVIWPHHWRLLSALNPILPSAARATASAVVAVSGVLLLRIAAGLRKRKRLAWRIAVAACAAISVTDLVRRDPLIAEGVGAAVLLTALLLARSRYTAQADPRSRWFALRFAAQSLGLASAYGLLLLYLPGHVASGTSFWLRLREVVLSIPGFGGWLPIRPDGFGDVFHATLAAFGALTAVAAVILLLRPAEPAAVLSDGDERRLRELLRRHGAADSLGYFALRRDKAVIWSATGKAAITYRVVLGVALASGDPIGDIEAWPGAIAAFRDLAERFGWTPAVIGCSERGAVVYRRELGLAALALGDEAVLRADRFSLDGRAMRCTRQASTRLQRAGYTVQVRRSRDVPPQELADIRTAAARWRTDAVERGYSMALSRLGDPADPDCVVVTAYRDGALRGVLHFVPWGERGISLDLMRRDRESDNGLNEFMIASVMAACGALGVSEVSLNFAVFRDALERGAQIGAGPVLRLWRRLLLVASRWWQIESLYRFNAKFQPEWRPRFVSYPRARDVPRVALAALEAEAFVARPRMLRRLVGRL
jgi:lysyl-tRNA synthetase class 2